MTLSRRETLAFLGTAGVLLPGVASASAAGAVSAEAVKEADRKFCAMAQKEGLVTAFSTYAAKGAVQLTPGKVSRGKEEIGNNFKAIPADAALIWEPEDASVSAGGDFGFTWGYWHMDKQGKSVLTGNYCTVWCKEDGEWRFLCDTGNTNPAKS